MPFGYVKRRVPRPWAASVANVTDMKSLWQMVQHVRNSRGRVDCLVNNAVIVAAAQLKNISEDPFDKVMAVNLKGVFSCAKAAVATMHGAAMRCDSECLVDHRPLRPLQPFRPDQLRWQ